MFTPPAVIDEEIPYVSGKSIWPYNCHLLSRIPLESVGTGGLWGGVDGALCLSPIEYAKMSIKRRFLSPIYRPIQTSSSGPGHVDKPGTYWQRRGRKAACAAAGCADDNPS